MPKPDLLRGFLTLCLTMGIASASSALGVVAMRMLFPDQPGWLALSGIPAGLILACVFCWVMERAAAKR